MNDNAYFVLTFNIPEHISKNLIFSRDVIILICFVICLIKKQKGYKCFKVPEISTKVYSIIIKSRAAMYFRIKIVIYE